MFHPLSLFASAWVKPKGKTDLYQKVFFYPNPSYSTYNTDLGLYKSKHNTKLSSTYLEYGLTDSNTLIVSMDNAINVKKSSIANHKHEIDWIEAKDKSSFSALLNHQFYRNSNHSIAAGIGGGFDKYNTKVRNKNIKLAISFGKNLPLQNFLKDNYYEASLDAKYYYKLNNLAQSLTFKFGFKAIDILNLEFALSQYICDPLNLNSPAEFRIIPEIKLNKNNSIGAELILDLKGENKPTNFGIGLFYRKSF